MSEPLIVAIPSKGRLQENTSGFFKQAGLIVERPGGDRNYRGRFKGLDGVEIAFLSASEISSELASGAVHFGITGLDLVHEKMPDVSDRDAIVHPVLPLGFGHADVVLAVPNQWIDVDSMTDLTDVALDFRAGNRARLRVATKYINLTNAFFAERGFTDYRIVESLGATEGAPAAGAAEVIVDITTTGSTLRANDLRVLDDGIVLRSEAHMMAAKTANWTEAALASAREILMRIAAQKLAQGLKILTVADPVSGPLRTRLENEFKCQFPFRPIEAEAGTTILYAPKHAIFSVVNALQDDDIGHIAVTDPDYVFTRDDRLYGELKRALPKPG